MLSYIYATYLYNLAHLAAITKQLKQITVSKLHILVTPLTSTDAEKWQLVYK